MSLLATAAVSFAAVTGGPVDPRGPVAGDGEPSGWHDRQIEWALAGVGPGARSIVVQPGFWGGCDKGPPKVRVTEGASEISVEVVVQEPDGIEAMICPMIARSSPPTRVALDAPVDGRRVVGPQRLTRPGAAMESRPGVERRVPRVVGLAARDARQALCGWLVRGTGATGDAVVARQSMPAGTPLPAPSGSTPERCAGLPDAPAVRLRAAGS